MESNPDALWNLIERASKQIGWVRVVHANGVWSAFGPATHELNNATYDQLVAKLKELATPPKPKTLTLDVPYVIVESIAESVLDNELRKICRAAIAPHQQPSLNP